MAFRAIKLAILAALLGFPAAPISAASSALIPIHPPRHVGPKKGTSTNWSGYATETNLTSPQSGAITDAKGTWTVPSVTCSNTDSYSATWVGIDGYSDSTVEQTGTEQDCVNGAPQYGAWYEMYPKGSYNVPLQIHPGDVMSAEVQYLGSGNFQLTLTDQRDGPNGTFTTTQKLQQAKLQSAEWIVEAPWSGGVLPLANFGSEAFSNASVTIGGTPGTISSGQYDPITLVDANGNPVATPSSLSAGGSSFTDTYSAPSGNGQGGKGGGHGGGHGHH